MLLLLRRRYQNYPNKRFVNLFRDQRHRLLAIERVLNNMLSYLYTSLYH
jgi:hypothetical protein